MMIDKRNFERTGHNSRLPNLFLVEPFLLFCPPFSILKRVAAVHKFPDSGSRFPFPVPPISNIRNSTVSSGYLV